MIDPLKCNGSHDHQPIEGMTRWQGCGIARSVFSERYPRKFARLLAKGILKKQFPPEIPFGHIADPALIALDQWFQISSALAAEDRMSKRQKLSFPRQAKLTSAGRSFDSPSPRETPMRQTARSSRGINSRR